jgi:hypothetical protein
MMQNHGARIRLRGHLRRLFIDAASLPCLGTGRTVRAAWDKMICLYNAWAVSICLYNAWRRFYLPV